MQLSNPPSAQAILMPVRAGTILASLAAAVLLNFLPWRSIALAPDFVALVRLATGAEFPGWAIAVGPLVGAVLWPVVSVLLLLPQRMPADVDETRAI